MEFTNQKSFAGGIVVAGACLVVGYFSGHLALFSGIAMIVVGGGCFVVLDFKGPESVEVHFGDSVNCWKRYRVRKVINRFFLHLRQLRLNPPVVSPTISIGTHPVLPHIGGMGCEGPASERGDRSTIDDKDSHSEFAIARAYSWCYFMRQTKANEPPAQADDIMKYTGRHTACMIVWDYFCLSFADMKFRPPGSYVVDKWISALLSMRLECGADCTDKAIANVVLDLASTPVQFINNDADEFSEWFWSRLNTAIWLVAFPAGAIEKAETAKRILVERGALRQ